MKLNNIAKNTNKLKHNLCFKDVEKVKFYKKHDILNSCFFNNLAMALMFNNLKNSFYFFKSIDNMQIYSSVLE